MFHEIKTPEDVKVFLDNTNALHDGYIIDVRYTNTGINKTTCGHYLDDEQTKLTLQILVTSIYDTVVEIIFENLAQWQITDNLFEIVDTSIVLNNQNYIIWSDNAYTNMDVLKTGSYVIAKSMKWRILN